MRGRTPLRFSMPGLLVIAALVLSGCAPFTATSPAPAGSSPVAPTSQVPGSARESAETPSADGSRVPSSESSLFAGTVRHAGHPVPDARVELRALGWATNKTPAVATIQADGQGNFSLPNPPVGNFSVVGYFPDGEMDAGGWPPVNIKAGQQVTGFVVPLERKLILLSPIADSAVTGTLAMSWRAAEGSSEYRVWVIDPGTTEVKLDRTTRDTTVAGPDGLAPGEYQWVVDGLDANGEVVATGQETFRVKATDGNTPGNMPRLPDNERAFAGARAALAKRLGIDELGVQRVEVTPREWKDSCLGVNSAGEMCAQVITPGWIVIMEAGGRRYEAHTDQEGLQVRFVGLQ